MTKPPSLLARQIAAIAEKLDLKKNVVRVWFCNQRQKQKRMKFAAQVSKKAVLLTEAPLPSLL